MTAASGIKRTAYSLLISILVCLLCVRGPFYTIDNAASDAFYQRKAMPDETIIVIGMDAAALERLGPTPWPRSVFARVIENLNSDPANRPAVIGLDIQFTGESLADPDGDRALAAACGRFGNVVTASGGMIGTDVRADGGTWKLETAVLGWEEPYGALKDAAPTGHVNAILDRDGILRHALSSLTKPDGTPCVSFSRAVYDMYCRTEHTGAVSRPAGAADTAPAGVFLIPFTAGHGGYEDSFTFLDCLDGPVSSRRLAGKIVLIGAYAPGMQDEYRTSLSRGEPMFGVEIQANLVDALLKDRHMQEAGLRLQILILFLTAFAAAFMLWNRRALPSLLIWLGSCGLWLAACLFLRQRGTVLHVLWVPLAVSVEFAVSVIWNYSRARRARQKVEQLFGRYVDPSVIRELLEHDAAADLGGKICDIAVLFVDIRGFTSMSESLPPTTVVEIVNRYLSLTTDCIMKNHGTLDKFVGDCTMAIWNAPVPLKDPVGLACKAAVEMVEGSAALGEELMRRFGRTVDFGIGINYGPAVVGNIGASRRMDYTAMGDTVNTAARLEANASGGTILISASVKEALGERARTTSLGDSIRLKGKAAGFEIFTLDELL